MTSNSAITLCGSMSFEEQFKRWNDDLSVLGFPVFTLTSFVSDHGGVKDWPTQATRPFFELAYFRKLQLSQAIVVMDYAKNGVSNYVGQSTQNQIDWALKHDIKVIFAQRDLEDNPQNIVSFLPDQRPELEDVDAQLVALGIRTESYLAS